MARHEATNGKLFALRDDINKQCNESAAFYYFNKEKISRFNSQNKLLLKILDDRLGEFIKKYVQHGEDGKPMTEEKDGVTVFVFESEEKGEAYLEEQKEFLARSIHIEL
jgi:hypothetical protein